VTLAIGIPREVKDGERRVGATPAGVRALVADGHVVRVQSGAGAAVGMGDDEYRTAGASVEDDPQAVWRCEVVVKVKEIQPSEYDWLRAGTTVFGFAQLNRDRTLTDAVLAARVGVIGYETVRDALGALPLLAPMSRIAGRLAPLVGAMAMTGEQGGAGVLLTGIDAVPGACVVVIGAGNVGREAARVALQLGCPTTVFSRGRQRLGELAEALNGLSGTLQTAELVDSGDSPFVGAVRSADLVIGAVLEPGTLSPKLLSRSLVRSMRRGAVIVDVGIDQGGIAETSRMTKLSDPVYTEEGVVHYAVPNMPTLVARTATLALTGATLPVVRALARDGVLSALAASRPLAAGLMVWNGETVHPGLACDQQRSPAPYPWEPSAGKTAQTAGNFV
jgi:alanine dehydrogenase